MPALAMTEIEAKAGVGGADPLRHGALIAHVEEAGLDFGARRARRRGDGRKPAGIAPDQSQPGAGRGVV